ncbi:MAG TPA: chromosomal replication initiator protein DnaA [Fibrobacteria bacterium]|nr:chromosomal replication initiator protein DnaA [Fibrobacteria bacterium]HOX50411.1 chromosomal replication initiator protein DnaA [Fibrobacteria bacterium]
MNSLLIHSESDRLWQVSLERISQSVSRAAFTAWFAPLRMGEWSDDGFLQIHAPTLIAKEFVHTHHKSTIEKALREELGAEVQVRIVLDPDASTEPILRTPAPRKAPDPLLRLVSPKQQLHVESVRREAARLAPRMTFDSFVEGDCNRLALAVARQVAENPGGGRANPLLLVGGTGLGKTHLMTAIGHFILGLDVARKVVYRTSEEFAREYLEVARKGDLKAFHSIYRDASVLLLDDIQFFGGEVDKPRFREQMVYVMSVLQAQRKQIILTCDRPPSEVQHFDRQILRQIESGFVADLDAPDQETRLAILRRKALEGGWNVTPDVLGMIAEQFTGNVRQLEGALLKLCAFSDMCGGKVDRSTAEAVFRDAVRNRKNSASPGAIAQAVADAFQIDLALMRSRTRKRPVVQARQLAMLLIHELTDNTLHSIGVLFGRDYSTVTHSLEAARESLSTDRELTDTFQSLRERFRS